MIAQLDSLYLKLRPWKLWARLVSYGLFEGRPLTTRGRWINPLVFAHFAVEKFLPQLGCVEKPVFILGTGRSGTTVLGIVLSMHREVGFLNEPKALWHSAFANEDLIGSYSLGLANYRLDTCDVTTKVKRNMHRLYGAYLAVTGSKRVVDKYPELIFRIEFVQEIFSDAKFIFLVRNGWDTCSSIQNWSRRLGVSTESETHDWWGVNKRKWNLLLDQVVSKDNAFESIIQEIRGISDHQDMAAVEWIVTMREGLRLIRENQENVLMLKYEDLVASPESKMTELFYFCGLPVDSVCVEYAAKTLAPVANAKAFTMHPCIVTLFNQTMSELGY